jgi:hypothetical protein
MLKELRYLLFIVIISIIIFLSFKFYFSETNKKNSYRKLMGSTKLIKEYSENLILLDDNTNNSIKFVKKNKNNKKNYRFWELIVNDK